MSPVRAGGRDVSGYSSSDCVGRQVALHEPATSLCVGVGCFCGRGGSTLLDEVGAAQLVGQTVPQQLV